MRPQVFPVPSPRGQLALVAMFIRTPYVHPYGRHLPRLASDLEQYGLNCAGPLTSGFMLNKYCKCIFVSCDLLNNDSFSLAYFLYEYVYNTYNIQNSAN